MLKNQKGFTLLELMIVIVILGILTLLAIPRYQNLTEQANEAECKKNLGLLRSGITLFYANEAVENGTARWPSHDEVVDLILGDRTLENPYQENEPYLIVSGSSADHGTIIGIEGGWVYNSETGEIWANTFGQSHW